MEYVIHYGVDGALALFLLLTIIHCARIGFARSLGGIVACVAAAAIALHFCTPLTAAVYDRYLHTRMVALAEENILKAEDVTETATYTNSILQELPDAAVHAAERLGIDVEALQYKTSQLPLQPKNAASSVERNFIAPIVKAAVRVVLFAAMFLVIAGLLQLLLTPVGKTLHKIPVIGTSDYALGAVFGLLKGAVLIAVLAMLAYVAADIVGGRFAEAVDNSHVAAFMVKSPFSNGLFR